MKVKLSPSLMCIDLLNIENEIKILNMKANEYHVDIIDWHYCKNMSLAPCFMEQISKITDIPMDAHLYVDNIDMDLIELCCQSGAKILTMPPEIIEKQVYRMKRYLDSQNVQFGVFINPAVSLEIIKPYAHIIDRLLIMSVDPGFAGQPFVEATLKKIAEAKQYREENHYHYSIAVDGCCNENYYKQLYEVGVDVFIVGTSGLFGKNTDTKKALDIAVSNIELATR